MALPSAPLPAGLPECRICGKEMREGHLEGEAGRTFDNATITWVDKATDQEEELAPVPLWIWSKTPQFLGYRCVACGIIELHLQSPQVQSPTGRPVS
jgi:hypothetical protein